MHIYKVVFIERKNFTNEEFEYLDKCNLIDRTSKGLTGIMSFFVKNCTNKKAIETLKERLGIDTYDLLLKGEIDLVLVVYC